MRLNFIKASLSNTALFTLTCHHEEMCEINNKMEENLKNHWLSKISEIKKENRKFFEHVPVKLIKVPAKSQTEPWLHFYGIDCSLARISVVIFQILQDAKE